MLSFIRHIAKVMTPVLMVLFFAILIADEYYDTLRAIDDLRIESCVELEAYDFEWDDDDVPDGIAEDTAFAGISIPETKAEYTSGTLCSSTKQSDKQLRGLVRRHAPRKGIVRTYYIWT